jgi:NTE family protein
MASIFLDSLASDIEQLEKMNRIAAQLTPAQRRSLGLREIQSLVIAPSQRIDGIAARFLDTLPRPVRALFEVVGANTPGGAALASYLLFERPFTCELIDLGVADTMARREEVLAFLTYSGTIPPPNAPRVVVS